MEISHHERVEDGATLPLVVWSAHTPRRTLSSAVLGGGTDVAAWVLNATVRRGYDRPDPAEHLAALAVEIGLTGRGVGMMTAVDVNDLVMRSDGGVVAWATVGVETAQWAAAPSPAWHQTPSEVGTINILVELPVALSPAAMVNAVATATEAKAQAMFERGLAGTGTPTDAICVSTPLDGPVEDYAGPRSIWGARIARSVHAAVAEGLAAGGDRT
jgi:adenosylcobinamide hydrolase